jgi:transposase
MESTGSYWIPFFNPLEGQVTVVLANPEEMKNRMGHKTDRKDAGHLANLRRHNHVKSRYIPAGPVRQLRDLTRRRVHQTQDATRERNRVQELLQQGNGKIGSVLTDMFNVSGLLIRLALLMGGLRQRKSLDWHADKPRASHRN